MKNHRFSRCLLLPAIAATLASLLCSCATPDPKFVENESKIANTNYPPGKIVGTWADFYISTVQSPDLDSEGKVYYEFRPGGKGTMRQASKNSANEKPMSIEGDFTWKYLGANRWMINLPASSEYRVTEANGRHMLYREAITLYARYYDEELYITTTSHVWVRADRDHVSQLARRIRETPAFRIGVQP